ncbi:MAG: anti-sigma factor antagonist [Clostridia bacterium]|nr:anti-sigma factor antagonist [Clostridia bacterium]
MDIDFIEKDKLLVLKITEEIDHHTTDRIRRLADYEIQRCNPRKVIFDFSGVCFMDSAGIGLIIGRYKTASMIGAKLEIKNVRDNVRKIFEMTGILKIIPIVSEEENCEEVI